MCILRTVMGDVKSNGMLETYWLDLNRQAKAISSVSRLFTRYKCCEG